MFTILEAGVSADGRPLPAFVVARDGLYLRKRSLLGVSQTKVERVAHLPAEREYVDYALPKVPSDLMARVVGFFRAVYRDQKTEALVLLLLRAGSFDLVVPEQKVTLASVRFDLVDGDLPAGSRLVGTIHSHGALGAFASSVDEDDEAELDGLHIVVGDLDRRPSYAAAIVVDGVRFPRKVSQLIERPRRLVEPPAGWLAAVRRAPVTRPKPSGPVPKPLGLLPAVGSRLTKVELDALLERADRMADALGYHLTFRLVPTSGAIAKGGGSDG